MSTQLQLNISYHIKDPVPTVQEAGWAPGPVWKGGKSRPPGFDPRTYNAFSILYDHEGDSEEWFILGFGAI